MKKKRERSLVSHNKPAGDGLASFSPSHKPQGNGLASASQSHSVEKARAYAFLLLKFRLRSEHELKLRLEQKGFPKALSQDTVNFLKDKEFIDDLVFARGWVAWRLKRSLGLRKIRQELVQKGLAQEIIDSALSQVQEQYNESQIVNQLAQQRFSKLKGIEPLKAKTRVYAYLIRRGFASDIVGEIVKKL